MANVLNNDKQHQIIALGRLGWSLRRIERETGIRRETISAYLKSAGVPVRPPRRWGHGPPDGETEAAKPAKEVTTDSEVTVGQLPTNSLCEPHRAFIEAALAQGRNAKAIWQDLCDRHGFSAGYLSVRRFVTKVRGRGALVPSGIIITAPGEEGQVDYGTGPLVHDPATGRYRRTRLFVLTLGYSRKSVRLLTFVSSSQVWAQLHETAFRRLGGTPGVIVLDNLKEGVLAPDIYDPTLNTVYRDMLAHYGCTALPCRVRDPDRKGKVESGVGHAQKTPLKGMRFESLAEAQAYLDHWEARWADTRIHGTTKRQVAAMFAEEQPALTPLPLTPFRYYRHGTRVVHLNGCVEVDAAYYSAPPRWIGQTVDVQWDDQHVRLLDPTTGALLREHLKQARGSHRLDPADRPAPIPASVQALLTTATGIGDQARRLCDVIHGTDGVAGDRRIRGVIALAKRHGAPRVETACAAALELGVPTYRFVRRWLEHHPAVPVTLKQIDPLIRELSYYRDLIEHMTQGGTP